MHIQKRRAANDRLWAAAEAEHRRLNGPDGAEGGGKTDERPGEAACRVRAKWATDEAEAGLKKEVAERIAE